MKPKSSEGKGIICPLCNYQTMSPEFMVQHTLEEHPSLTVQKLRNNWIFNTKKYASHPVDFDYKREKEFARNLADNLERYNGKRTCPICGHDPEYQVEYVNNLLTLLTDKGGATPEGETQLKHTAKVRPKTNYVQIGELQKGITSTTIWTSTDRLEIIKWVKKQTDKMLPISGEMEHNEALLRLSNIELNLPDSSVSLPNTKNKASRSKGEFYSHTTKVRPPQPKKIEKLGIETLIEPFDKIVPQEQVNNRLFNKINELIDHLNSMEEGEMKSQTEGKKIMVLNKTQWKFRKQAQEQFPDAIIIKDKPMKSKSSEGKGIK